MQYKIDTFDRLKRHHVTFEEKNEITTIGKLNSVLPKDLVEFYKHTDGAILFEEAFKILGSGLLMDEHQCFLPKEIYLKECGKQELQSEYIIFCLLADGDALAVRKYNLHFIAPIFYLDHEMYPDFEAEIIAGSFSIFLEAALDSGGNYWWI